MKKQISCLISAAVLATAVSGFAAFEQTGDETMRFSGNAGAANTEVGIQVFASGKTTDDLEAIKNAGEGNYLDVIIYHDQAVTDSEGNYEFYVDLAKSGKYIAYIGYADGTEIDAQEFMFVDAEDYKGVAGDINDMSASEIKDVISENPYVLGLAEDELKNISLSGLASVIEETLNETEFSEDDRDASWAIIDKALFVQKLNDGLVSDIYDIDETLSALEASEVAEYLEADYVTEDLKKNFTERLNNKNLKSYGDYKDAITEAFILATVNYPNGSANVKNILTAFEDKIGINVKSDTPSTTWNKLSGKDYADYADLEDGFETYSKVTSDKGSGSGSSGSSGKGSKVNNTTGIGSMQTAPVVDNNTGENTMLIPIFDDIDSVEWAKPAIVYLTEKQILDGVGGKKFNPNGLVLREQLAKIVVGAFAEDAEAGENNFSDVDNNAWYAPFVLKANAKGIVNGLGDGTFGVGKNVTRQDMCVMIYNAAKAKGYNLEADNGTRKFKDDDSISDYAKEAVYALRNAGVVSGMTADEFVPYGTATRAQVAKIVYYILETL